MNVQELIDELQKVEDKSKTVLVSMGNVTVGGLRFNRDEATSVDEIYGNVWIANERGTAKFFREKYGDIQ